MEILVCVKQVPDDSVEIHLDPNTQTPDLSKADPQGSAFDTYALEMAVRFVEANGGSVTVASVGPDDSTKSLKDCLAVGAKNAFLINDVDPATADASVIADAIAAAIPKMEEANGAKFDLIFTGKESTDYIDGEVGEELAEKLALPFVTNVVEIETADAGLHAKKELDAGYDIVETAIPAVMTASKPDYDPRFPTIKSKLAARKAKIPAIEAGIDAQPRVEYAGYAEPPKKAAGEKIIEDDPEVAFSKALELMQAAKVL